MGLINVRMKGIFVAGGLFVEFPTETSSSDFSLVSDPNDLLATVLPIVLINTYLRDLFCMFEYVGTDILKVP